MISLQNYSTYSNFSGVMEPKVWAKKMVSLGITAFGITDKQTCAAHVEFKKALNALNGDVELPKLLYGEEFILTADATSKESEEVLLEPILFAMNDVGYKNLVRLNNFAGKKIDQGGGFYYKPRIDLTTLLSFKEGLICVFPQDGCFSEKPSFPSLSLKAKQVFGDNFYIGLNPSYGDLNKAKKVAQELEIQVCMTHNCHYPEEADEKLYPFVRTIARNSKSAATLDRDNVGSLEDAVSEYDEEFYADALRGSEEIVAKCNYDVSLAEVNMPQPLLMFESLEEDLIHHLAVNFKKKIVPDADISGIKSIEDFYRWNGYKSHELVEQGIDEEDIEDVSVYVDRLIYEYGIINDLGYPNYFHIVENLCRFVDQAGEDRGFARGSAGGSLFSYLLNITKVDPIYHGLSFERFLNPDRNDLPDIDLDFSSSARDVALTYLRKAYGEKRVVAIGSYQRWKIASSIHEAARAFEYFIPANSGDISKYSHGYLSSVLKDGGVAQTSRGAKELEERLRGERFKDFYEKHSEWIDEYIMPLQNSISGNTVHPCGYLILPEDIDDCMPVRWNGRQSQFTTMFKDRDCEDKGYPKFDLLVVDGVDVASYAKKLIRRRGGEVPEFERVSLKDAGTLAMFKEAFTSGIFQFKTWSQKQFLTKLKPEEFFHLVAAIALVRPGPIENGADKAFYRIKNGKEEEKVYHEDLRDVLGSTYGLPIFQEQIMKIAQVIAGFSGSEADYLRKAVGKKKIDQLEKWGHEFKTRAVDKGYDESLVNELWSVILAFGGYGFNLSHSVGYVLLSFYQMYLKFHHPQEFWCASMRYANDNKDSDSSVFQLKVAAENDGMNFIYPTIFNFAESFGPVDDNRIVWPVQRIKRVGEKAAHNMAEGGRTSFSSLEEMFENTERRLVNKSTVKALLGAGFFDPLGPVWEVGPEIEEILGVYFEYDYSDRDPYKWQLIRNECYGMQVTSWKEVLKDRLPSQARKITTRQFSSIPESSRVMLVGKVEGLEIKRTKNGSAFASCWIKDFDENHKVMFWGDYWENIELDKEDKRLSNNDIILVVGKKNCWSPPDGDKVHHSLTISKRDTVEIIKRGGS